MGHPDKISVLLEWCSSHGIKIDLRLRVVCHDENISVRSNGEEIAPFSSVVHIPKDAVLSVKSSSVSSVVVASPVGHEAQLSLALALYVELVKGESSRWHGYLQSLPTQIVDIPILWQTEDHSMDSTDRRDALRWLKGTEVERDLLACVDSLTRLDELRHYYCEVVETIFNAYFQDSPTAKCSLHGFYHAYSLVSSRAFLIDAYHGLSMVPIADAFNHSQENHVHLESEYDVCPECGSLKECPHDDEPSLAPENLEDHFEMVSNTLIPSHGEVFNTYGETLSNAQLLLRYGFILDVNDNDQVIWGIDELLEDAPEHITDAWRSIDIPTETWQDRFSGSELVRHHSGKPVFCVDCDGRVSHHVWLFYALLACVHLRYDYSLVVIADRLVEREGLDDQSFTSTVDRVIADIAASIIALCMKRQAQLGDPTNEIDALDLKRMPLTRSAMLQVMSERSILESCRAGWLDFMILS
ncbi:SET domain-containing protein [Guyanagaster necrorhizus]|uniref:SET domain-containing protein n=1 Tax=Guyanagaster necrorhizus TaxID=856835 RepID=A0A9P7VWP1_9AGAR|nr:SET domain-containing protein [Guyanagaster necrorhizus MCA 3950]KAG7448678.1 SET domain-containing protein [Guyanagaster necrorhizus MCA 3950]